MAHAENHRRRIQRKRNRIRLARINAALKSLMLAEGKFDWTEAKTLTEAERLRKLHNVNLGAIDNAKRFAAIAR